MAEANGAPQDADDDATVEKQLFNETTRRQLLMALALDAGSPSLAERLGKSESDLFKMAMRALALELMPAVIANADRLAQLERRIELIEGTLIASSAMLRVIAPTPKNDFERMQAHGRWVVTELSKSGNQEEAAQLAAVLAELRASHDKYGRTGEEE
jgi:hypothetical protein